VLKSQVERGLERLDDMAQKRLGKGFAAASPAEQDELLRAFQKPARGLPGAHVFSLLLTLTLEGFLSDPATAATATASAGRSWWYRDCFYHGRGIGLSRKVRG